MVGLDAWSQGGFFVQEGFDEERGSEAEGGVKVDRQGEGRFLAAKGIPPRKWTRCSVVCSEANLCSEHS